MKQLEDKDEPDWVAPDEAEAERRAIGRLVEDVAWNAIDQRLRELRGPTERRPSPSVEVTYRRKAIVTMLEPGKTIRA